MKIQRNMGDELSYVQEVKALRAFRRSMEYSVFIGHVRSKDDFMRSHRDPLLWLPPAYTAERAVAAHWVRTLLCTTRRRGCARSVAWRSHCSRPPWRRGRGL